MSKAAKDKTAKDGETIEETIARLGIDPDPDVDTEVAVQDAAERSRLADEAEGTEVRAVVPLPRTSRDTDDSEDEEEAPPRFPLPETESFAPMPTGLVPPPKTDKARTRQRSPVAGKLGKGLSEKLPGAEKVKVYKRKDGQRWFVRDYTTADLAQFSDFESFLTRYVKPEYGPGEYDLVGVDAYNREIQVGQVRLLQDPKETRTPETGAYELVSTMLEQQKEQNREWLDQMKEAMRPPAQQSPIELLQGVMAVTEKLDAKNNEGASSTMQMMMAMMQQNTQMMMAMLSKPKEEDPLMKLLIMKLLKDDDAPSGGGHAIPAPPAPANPFAGMAEMMTAMGGLMAAMGGGGGGGDDDFKEFLKTLLLKSKDDALGIKDVLELVKQQQDKPGGADDFNRAINNLAAIMNVANNINRNQEGGGAAGLFDALAALFSNRDFAGSIAQAVRSKVGSKVGSEEQRLAAEGQRLQMERRLLERERAQVAANGGRQPAQQTAPQPHAQPAHANGNGTAPPSQEQVQEAAQRHVERTGQLPQLPANTVDHLTQIAAAKDDGELVGATVQMIIYFAEFSDWRPFSETLLSYVREGNKRETMRYLSAFFEGLVQIQLFPLDQAKRVIKAMLDHFSTVQAQLADIQLEGDGKVSAQELVETPPSS